jgi:uncharacterized protein with von Willebrand factor type A (vWA) domain
VEARLAGFARVLRHHGLRVSPGEVVDAARAAALVGVGERDALRAALRATLVKRSADVAPFERLFDAYFSPLAAVVERIERDVLDGLDAAGDGRWPAARAELERALAGLSPLARAALAGDRRGVARLLGRGARALDFGGLQAPSQVAFYARRLLGAAGGSGAGGEPLLAAARDAGLGAAALALLSRRVERALAALEDAARRWVEVEQRARAEAHRREPLFAALAAPTREERDRIDAAVRRLAERLKARIVRRERSRRRGALNVRRTLRRNLGLGGVPARLAFRRRRPERPDVVVLCDVSDSVRHVSRVMLLFVHALQGVLGRVRGFVFVSDLAEVSDAFRREADVGRALDLALAGGAALAGGNSNYGRALRLFRERHLAAISRRTTLLVIGDGRNNYNPPHAEVLRELRRRARRVLWICPEERWAWGQGDSEMPTYAACADRVAIVTRLADLEAVADELVPR